MEPKISADRFFQLIAERKLTEAERELDAIRQSIGSSDWGRGTLKALEGLLLTEKSNNDKFLYLSKIGLDQKDAKKLKTEFLRFSSNKLHAEYDRGYFRTLADYMKVVADMNPDKKRKNQ